MSEQKFDELLVCKDLLWELYHGSTYNFKYRGITYIRKQHDLRNSEICELLGISNDDIELILNNNNNN